MQHKLTAKQKRFSDEFLVDMNATQAYKRAGYSAKSDAIAGVEGHKLLKNPKIAAYIAERQKAREQRTEITQDMVLQRWWAIANANPNELIYHRRVCCRYCFGRDHEYQWIDETEYERAVKFAVEEAKVHETEPEIPSYAGGYGFDPTIRPHPKCPKCHGEGRGDVQATDTRDLGPEARMLYAGVKVTKDGFEIKMRDQDKALENVARHLGMFKDGPGLTVNVTNRMDFARMSDEDLERIANGDDA